MQAPSRKNATELATLISVNVNKNKYFIPGLNWGPLACEASVITTRPTELVVVKRVRAEQIVFSTPGAITGSVRSLVRWQKASQASTVLLAQWSERWSYVPKVAGSSPA